MPHPIWFWALISIAFPFLVFAVDSVLGFFRSTDGGHIMALLAAMTATFALGLAAVLWALYLQGWLS